MKRFALKLLIFILIVVCIDISYGYLVRSYRRDVKAGMTRLDNIAVYETQADVLVFGSSRARRHYDTRILTDSLGMSAFNCGYNSMGIEFFYPRLKQILSRHTPKMIIYDITPLYDVMQSNSKNVNILRLKPYFHDPIVSDAIMEFDVKEWIKLHSATYRFHGEMKQYMADQDNTEKFFNGYAPLNGTLKIDFQPHAKMVPDSAKLIKVEQFIKLCKQNKIDLYFVISPYFNNDMGDQSAELRNITSRYNVPVLDHFNDAAYLSDTTLYWDASHLNSKGAEALTRQITGEILALKRR
ncbi:MAG: SGNH/GDSL hydrolase family protein [Prevotella sp.]|nr:SGNH/GDSL hydrolase family protein [Prevotella sp.]MCM1075076.1 SGNH/GDSL hydrolase family protein [Ruminococcus sp.]